MQINLQFSEREYLRGKASEIVLFRENSKFPLRILFPPSLHSTPRPQKFPSPLGEGLGVRPGQGEGLLFPFVSVCPLGIPEGVTLATAGTQERTHSPQGENIRLSQYVKDRFRGEASVSQGFSPPCVINSADR